MKLPLFWLAVLLPVQAVWRQEVPQRTQFRQRLLGAVYLSAPERAGRLLKVPKRAKEPQRVGAGFGVQYVLLSQLRQNWRLHIEYQLNKVFGFKARTELVRFSSEAGPQEDGFSAFIEGVWRQGTILFANLRLQYFSTDSYNSRIYAYESDLLYHFYIPAVFNRGVRY